MTARIIAVVNQKGGVGKTTTTINLATALAAVDKRVLIIDIDPQGNTSTGFGIPTTDRTQTIYEVLIGHAEIQDAVIPTGIRKLDIITSTVDLSAAEIELVSLTKRESRLKQAIAELKSDYDYIFIDCPPSLGLLTVNALAAAHALLIPLQCEFFALEGLSHLLRTTQMVQKALNRDLELHGVVLTMVDKRNKLAEQVERDVRNFLKDKVYRTIIPRNIRVTEAPSFGKPAIIFDLHCPGSRAYVGLASEFLQRERQVQQPREKEIA